MRIIVWEPDPNGHRYVYCRQLLSESEARHVQFATSKLGLNSNQYEIHLSEYRDSTIVAPTLPAVLHTMHSLPDAHLIIPNGDPHLLAVVANAWALPKLTTILLMNDPRWSWRGKPIRSLVKYTLVEALRCRHGVRVLTLRPNVSLDLLGDDEFPDPVLISREMMAFPATATALRHTLGLSEDVIWVGLVGGIEPHKNPRLVFEAVELIRRSSTRDIGLALLGPVGSRSRDDIDWLKSAATRMSVPLALYDKRLSNEQVNAAVAALDVLVCAYDTNAPNSTAAKAYYLGTRVVGCGSRCFLSNGSRYWTATAQRRTARSLARAICKAIDSAAPRRVPPPVASEFSDRVLGIR